MEQDSQLLQETVDGLLSALPSLWGRIRTNLRTAATQNFNITLEQFHVLRHIRYGFDSVAALAEKKGISRPAASQAVTELVKRGLVTRRVDAVDRSSVHLELTPHAADVLDANYAANRLWMLERMRGLKPDELRQVQQSMEILQTVFLPDEK